MDEVVGTWQRRLDFLREEYFSRVHGTVRRVDEQGRLHCDDGPAYLSPARVTFYKAGRKHGIDADAHGTIHYYHEGVRIPPKWHAAKSNPAMLTVEEILAHPNLEVRMIGIRIIGVGSLLGSRKCRVIDRCPRTGMVLFKIRGFSEQPVRFLRVINSTPEEDGSSRDYFLCVPPTMRRCREAVAWTFGLAEDEYNPGQET